MTTEEKNEKNEISEDSGTEPITADVVDTTTSNNKAEHHEHHEREQVYLSKKEVANLKRNGYEQAMRMFKETFVILNKKTGMVVEMKAASSTHACNMIGWRPKNCKVMKVEVREEPKAEVSAVSQSPVDPLPVEDVKIVEIQENKENVQ